VVIGATGDVGRGIVRVLIERGHRVAAVARNAARLQSLGDEFDRPERLLLIPGSVASDDAARSLLQSVQSVMPRIDHVVVTVNARRESGTLLQLDSDALTERLRADLVSHYTAARTFTPALAQDGVYLGIGGGSADFILEDGIYMSVAQAGLRMLYRGLALELERAALHIRELIIASVVNGASTRAHADPLWVTDQEIGAQVADMLEHPASFPGPIWRMSRRDETGRPVVSAEAPTRAQRLPSSS
jgi:NAD(P)-dependent dehydrogenase (short-subunit alcohol dehydrogenase family)